MLKHLFIIVLALASLGLQSCSSAVSQNLANEVKNSNLEVKSETPQPQKNDVSNQPLTKMSEFLQLVC